MRANVNIGAADCTAAATTTRTKLRRPTATALLKMRHHF